MPRLELSENFNCRTETVTPAAIEGGLSMERFTGVSVGGNLIDCGTSTDSAGTTKEAS